MKLGKLAGLVIASALLINAGTGLAQDSPPAAATQDAAREKPIPCSVLAHGMGAVIDGLEGKSPNRQCDSSIDPASIALDRFIAIIPEQHPAFYFILAARLFEAQRQKEAVFWFYAGQLRARIRLGCHPDLPPDGEPALFGALNATVGETIIEYAGADPEAWAGAMERTLDWDAATPNGFEPKTPCTPAVTEQRKRLADLRQYVLDHKQDIKAERSRNGLDN